MLRVTEKNIRKIYAAVQFLYWLAYALLYAYASTFLQDKGFADSQIGLTVGLAYLLASVLQPAFARLYNAVRLSLERCMCLILGVIILLSVAVMFAGGHRFLLCVLVVINMGTYAALQPAVNAMVQRWEQTGGKINFGIARSVGTLAYALMSFFFGQLLKTVSPGYLPVFYAVSMALFGAMLLAVVPPAAGSAQGPDPEETAAQAHGDTPPGSDRFMIVIIGIGFLIFGHSSFDCFLLQILQNVGGNSTNIGTAILIGAIVEIVAMIGYDALARRFGDRKLLIFAALMWVLKLFTTYLARSPMGVYGAELFQMLSFAIYTPAIVSYVNSHFSGKENLKWHSYTGSAYTVGSVLASFCGGLILEAAGASVMLLAATAATGTGALIFVLYFKRTNA